MHLSTAIINLSLSPQSTVIQCTGLNPARNKLRTQTIFPVETGKELTVACEEGFLKTDSHGAVSCVGNATFTTNTTLTCVGLGEYHEKLINFVGILLVQ